MSESHQGLSHPRPQLIDVKCWRSHLSNFCSSQRSSGVFKPINYVVNVKLWSAISPWCAVEDGREVLNLNNTCFSISQLSSVWSPQSWKDGCSLRTISAGAVFPAQDQNRSSVWAAPLSVLVWPRPYQWSQRTWCWATYPGQLCLGFQSLRPRNTELS